MRILIAGRDKSMIHTLEAMADGPMREIAVRHVSNGHADPLNGIAELPDLLIFHAGANGAAELESLIERPATQRPETLVIGPAADARLMRLALKAGARDYLGEPLDRDELLQNIEHVEHEMLSEIGPHDGKLIAVVGAKGGIGASFVAANLAHVLADQSHERTALVDLDLQYACLAQYLGLEPRHGLIEVLETTDELDTVALDAYMTKHQSGLSLIGPMTDEMILPGRFPAERLGQFYELLKDNYSQTIVDQSREVDEVAASTYEKADHVLLIVQQDVASIRDANKLRRLLTGELQVEAASISVVVNRYNKNSTVELADIARSMSVPRSSISVIPNHYRDVAESINVGLPLMEHAGGSAVSKALVRLANHFNESGGKQSTGLLSRAFSNLLGA